MFVDIGILIREMLAQLHLPIYLLVNNYLQVVNAFSGQITVVKA